MKNIVIVGEDLFAERLAIFLNRKDSKITMVVQDKERALDMSTDHSNMIIVNGNSTDPKILDEVKLENCDIFVAANEEENINLLAAVYAKKAGVLKIFVRTSNPYTSKIMEDIGLIPINCDFFAASSAALKITEPLVFDLVAIGVGRFEIVEKKAEFFPNIIGKKVSDVRGEFFGTLALFHDAEYHFAPDTKIKEDSILICIREAGKREDMRKAIKDLFK